MLMLVRRFSALSMTRGHGIVRFYVVLDDQLHSVGSLGDWLHRNVSLGVGVLDCVLVRRNISLGQGFHLIGVLLELFLLLFDYALPQSPTSTSGILRGRGCVQRCFYWLPVGTQANLEAFLLPFLPLKADGHPLKPGVLLELFFVLRAEFFQIGNTLLQIGILSREPRPNQGQHYRETNKRAAAGRFLRDQAAIVHKSPLRRLTLLVGSRTGHFYQNARPKPRLNCRRGDHATRLRGSFVQARSNAQLPQAKRTRQPTQLAADDHRLVYVSRDL